MQSSNGCQITHHGGFFLAESGLWVRHGPNKRFQRVVFRRERRVTVYLAKSKPGFEIAQERRAGFRTKGVVIFIQQLIAPLE